MASSANRLLVIGAGPGGYAAAFYAADLGMQVTLVDKQKNPGGVCLFRGCIPSKALLHAAKILTDAKEAKEIGIEFSEPKINLDQVRSWKNSVVEKLTGGLGKLSKQRKINFIQGAAQFIDSSSAKISKTDGGEETLSFGHAIIATGSHPIRLPFAPDSKRILDSTSALNIEDIPQKLLVIGGGYIGLELGSVYHAMGSKITVVEMLPNILPGADRDLSQVLLKRIKNQFADIKLNTKVTRLEETSEGLSVAFENKEGKIVSESFDKVLISIGRKVTTEGLGLENTKVTTTEKGFINVDLKRQTTDPDIYAIGDIAGEPMLAHKASHEGRVAVEAILGHKVAFEPKAIPAVVFTDPEIAWCGLTETEAREQSRDITTAKFPWAASGRAITLNRPEGLTKLIIDTRTERVLGVALAGTGAGEMIAEGVVAVEMSANAKDLKLCIHPHPTLSETLMEAAESFFGLSTHIYRPKKK